MKKRMVKNQNFVNGRHASSRLHILFVVRLAVFVSRLLTLSGDMKLKLKPVNQQQASQKASTSDVPVHNTRSLTYACLLVSSLSTLSPQPSVADAMEKIRSFRDTFNDIFNHLTAAFEMQIFSVETSLSTVESDMISLIDRVSICEGKLFTLEGHAQVNSILSAMCTSYGSLTIAANINIPTYFNVATSCML